jgi:heterodisulfide reductase subunit A-like polyferredoxin
MDPGKTDVAVIGLGTFNRRGLSPSRGVKMLKKSIAPGALGLVTLKNLAEVGFRVTGFERNGYIGGLWKYVEGDTTSVLQCKSSALQTV